MSKNENYTKSKRIGIRVYPHEYKEIEEVAEEELEISVSDFVRRAIREKMDRVKNPESYGYIVNENENQVAQNQIKLEKMEGLIAQLVNQIKYLTEINQKMMDLQMEFPSKLDKVKNLREKIDIIKGAMIEHRATDRYKRSETGLSIEEIAEKTKLDPDLIFDILINTDEFRELNGGWDIND